MLLVLIAAALRYLFDPLLESQGIGIFLGAVLIAAWFGGVVPAILCLLALHVVHGYSYRDPPRIVEWTLSSTVTTISYYLVGMLVGVLSELRAKAQRHAADEHREAIRQREHLRAILECMADGVLVTDAEGRLTLLNPFAEAATGWNLGQASGRPWHEVFQIRSEEGPETAEQPIEHVLRDGRVIHQKTPLRLTSRTGRTLPISYSAAPVQGRDATNTGAVLIFRDETVRQRTELALRNADRRKDEFLATLAHELRNPLAPISMGLEILQLSADDPETAAEIRPMMQRQTLHMVRLIDDLLDVSRITRGKLVLQKSQVDLSDIVRNALDAARPWIDEADHHVSVHLPDKRLMLYADAGRLTQVFTNLLNNAAKYTPRAGQIDLIVEQHGGFVTVTVSDTGIGISPDKLEQVFDMFAQLHDPIEHGPGGLGIGLTLVKELVVMHAGTVDVESRGNNLGTTFHVRLPVLSEQLDSSAGCAKDECSLQPATKHRVLVVDDNCDALEALSRLLTSMGHDVYCAHDGLEALELGQRFRPNIVLMDLGMPKLNGFEAARRMRQESWGKDLALVATSGWGQAEDRRRSAEAGFDRHLVKPVTVEALRKILEVPVHVRSAKPGHLPVPICDYG